MGWLVALILIVGIVYLLSREQKRLRSRTEEEYQRDVEKAGQSLVGAAMFELQKTLQPEARSAIEYILDERQDRAEEKQKAGESPSERRSF
jgi:hypothetical protein